MLDNWWKFADMLFLIDVTSMYMFDSYPKWGSEPPNSITQGLVNPGLMKPTHEILKVFT